MHKLYVKIGDKFEELSAVAIIPNLTTVKAVSIRDAIQKYLEICTSQKCVKNQKVEKTFFNNFCEYLNKKGRDNISDVSYKDLLEFQNSLSLKIKNSSINRRFFTVKHFFVMCEDWELILKNPAKKIKNKKVEDNPHKVWTDDEFERFIDQCDGIRKSLLLFLWNTGCRPMEAKNLKWTDIDFDKLQITLRCGKNAKIKRLFPMTDKVSSVLHNIQMKGDSVFDEISNDSLYQYTKHRLNKLKMNHLSPYGLRHSFASRLSHSGVNVFLIQILMGHSDIKTTSIYVHSEKKELIAALKCANF